MTYNTPELLLVGAAQSLVLGGTGFKGELGATNFDDLERKVYIDEEAVLDSGNW